MIAEDEAVKELLSRRYDDTVLVAEDDDDIKVAKVVLKALKNTKKLK